MIKVMLLRGVKVDFIENINEMDELTNSEEQGMENYCFFFSSNKRFYILFANNKTIFSHWKEKLSTCCTLSYFSKNYQNSKIIGKGTFAKVIVAKKLSD